LILFREGLKYHIFPRAKISFDEFYVIQVINEVVNGVRREEVKTEPDLIGSRWGYLKNASNWIEKQINQMCILSRMRIKTTKAWQLKEPLKVFRAAHGRHKLRLCPTSGIAG
jgi:transposase